MQISPIDFSILVLYLAGITLFGARFRRGQQILCDVLIPQYFQGEFYTAYQLLEKRFGARMRSVAALVFMGTRALAEGVRISAIGKVVSVAFGTGDRVSILIITVLTMFYTFEGGMRAVIWTDVLQFFLY